MLHIYSSQIIFCFRIFQIFNLYLSKSSEFAYPTEQYISHRKSPDIYDVVLFITYLQFKWKMTFISRDLIVSIQPSCRILQKKKCVTVYTFVDKYKNQLYSPRNWECWYNGYLSPSNSAYLYIRTFLIFFIFLLISALYLNLIFQLFGVI